MKSNTKKRLIAFMLCMVLVLSSTISAFADEPQNTDSQSQTEAVAEPAADEANKNNSSLRQKLLQLRHRLNSRQLKRHSRSSSLLMKMIM